MSAFKFALCHRNKVLRPGTQEKIMIILASSFNPRLFSFWPPTLPSPSTHGAETVIHVRWESGIRAPLLSVTTPWVFSQDLVFLKSTLDFLEDPGLFLALLKSTGVDLS